jgi:hypothetical protein
MGMSMEPNDPTRGSPDEGSEGLGVIDDFSGVGNATDTLMKFSLLRLKSISYQEIYERKRKNI